MSILSHLSLLGLVTVASLAVSLGASEGAASASPPVALDDAPVCREPTAADREGYAVSLVVRERCKVGQKCAAEVTIEARGNHTLSKDFAFTFQAASASSSVKYLRPTLTRKDGVFDEKKGVIKVPFSVSAAGTVKLAGKQAIMVSDKSCLMEKLDLELDVDVK